MKSPNSVGSYEFRPQVPSMKIHPGKLYDTAFFSKNLTDQSGCVMVSKR